MNKKSQIKFGESIGIIFIVYIILMVGLIWYNGINNKDLKDLQENDKRDRAFEKYEYIVNLDLLHKSQRGSVDEEFNSISLKVFLNFSETEIGKKYLEKRLGESTIIIHVYNQSSFNNINETNMQETIVLYNKTPANRKEIIKKDNFRTLIPIQDPITKQNNVGLLILTDYLTET